MHKLPLTHYKNTKSKTGTAVEVSWPADVSGFTEPVKSTRDRESVPLLMAGTTDGSRGDAHVVARSMLVVDVDCKPKDDESPHAWKVRAGKTRALFEDALKFLAGPEGFDHAWHTTHSHTDTNRLGWRVWIPLEKDVPASQLARWRDANHALNVKVFERIADTTAYNPERLMRLPAVHPDFAHVFKAGARTDGKLLDFETVLGWWKDMPPEERNRQRGQRLRDTPRIYAPTIAGDSDFSLPAALVDNLRMQCAQIAQGNDRLKIETRAALQAIAQCESLQSGARDNGLIGLVGFFSNRFVGHEARPLLDSLLLPVLEKTHADAPDDPIKPGMPDPRDLCDWAIAQVEARREEARNPLGHTKVTDDEAAHIRDWTEGARSGGMAEAEFIALAKERGLDAATLRTRLFVRFKKDMYIWAVNRYLPRALELTELTLGIAQSVLAGVGISRRRFDEQKAEFKTLGLTDILNTHQALAHKVRASYKADRAHFDESTKTFIEAFGTRRKLEPEFHQGVQDWLIALGLDTEKVVDWVSVLPDPGRALSILFITMPKNAGKNLLAQGLGRLWQVGAPADADRVLGAQFNDPLEETPFVFADEHLPKVKNIGAVLRNLISNPDVAVRRMYRPIVKCEGYVRMLVAANNNNPLKDFGTKESQMTARDLEAIAERTIIIDGTEDQRAVKVLEKYAPAELDAWKEDFLIAKHALWLNKNWKLSKQPGRRFAVEGDSEKALYNLVTGDELTSQLLEWFVEYALDPKKRSQSNIRQGLFSSRGELYVTLSVITSTWQEFRPAYRMGSTSPFLSALEAVSWPGSFRAQRGAGSQKDTRDYWRIRFDYLEFYAQQRRIGSATVRRSIMERDDPDAEFVTNDGEPAAVVEIKRRAEQPEELAGMKTPKVTSRKHAEEI